MIVSDHSKSRADEAAEVPASPERAAPSLSVADILEAMGIVACQIRSRVELKHEHGIALGPSLAKNVLWCLEQAELASAYLRSVEQAKTNIETALKQLANEVGALRPFEDGVREAIGHTNANVLFLRLAEADAALARVESK